MITKEDNYNYAELLNGIRRALEISQDELAKRMGVVRLTIIRWENSQSRMTPRNKRLVLRLAHKAGIIK